MTDFYIASDNIDGKESSYLNKMKSKLETGGNKVDIKGVGPNTIQSAGLSGSSKGKTGVFLVGGSDAGMYVDFVKGVGSYYHYDLMWVAFAGWIGNDWITEKGLKSKKLVRAHDDNYSGSNIESVGKTAKQYFDEHSDKIKMAYGNSPEALATMILNGGGSSDNSDDDSSSGAKSAWDICKEVCGKNNDDVMFIIWGDTVYGRRVPDETYVNLSAKENYNIVQDSITITEANPLTTNTLEVSYGSNEKPNKITLKSDVLVKRYGEIKETLDVGNVSLKEAKAYGTTYLDKILRNSGMQIECQVIGHPEFYIGRWCNFYSPRFDHNEEKAFFITKISQSTSATDANLCNLTMVEYAPNITFDSENSEGIEVEESEDKDKSSDDSSSSDSSSEDSSGDE